MTRSEVNALTLVAIFIATSVSAEPLVGIVLLIVLFAFDREGYRDSAQSLGFGAVAGYCAARVVLPLLRFLPASVFGGLGQLPWPSIIWIVAALTFWAVDISRMGKRAVAQSSNSRLIPQAAPAVMTAPILVRDESVLPVEPAPVQSSAPQVHAPVRPAATTSLFSQPLSATSPKPAHEIARAPVTPQPMQAIPVLQGAGKPAAIYLNLVGEGLPVLRSVQAEHLGKDYYLIVEPMPLGENWEFQPGQVVRCQKRNLSNGKALVAVEEAPRAS